MDGKLRAGLAVYGSALDRWHLDNFLKDAGLHTNNAYQQGSRDYRVELTSEGIKDDVEIVALRPEIAPEELWAIKNDTGSLGLDIAIMGSDIAAEGEKSGYPVTKLGSIGMGRVEIVMAVQKDMGISSLGELLGKRRDLGKPTICATEYYKYRAAETIANDPVYQDLYPKTTPQIMVGGKVIDGNNPMVVVKYSEGKTEISCVSGFAHLIVENSQSGETLGRNDYQILQHLDESWYRLYAGPHITRADKGKWSKAMLVRDALRGKAVGQRYTYVAFDFESGDEDTIMNYMEKEALYSEKPFRQRENGKVETKILVPRKKMVAVIGGLSEHGAKAISTFAPEIVKGLPGYNDEELDKMVETPI